MESEKFVKYVDSKKTPSQLIELDLMAAIAAWTTKEKGTKDYEVATEAVVERRFSYFLACKKEKRELKIDEVLFAFVEEEERAAGITDLEPTEVELENLNLFDELEKEEVEKVLERKRKREVIDLEDDEEEKQKKREARKKFKKEYKNYCFRDGVRPDEAAVEVAREDIEEAEPRFEGFEVGYPRDEYGENQRQREERNEVIDLEDDGEIDLREEDEEE